MLEPADACGIASGKAAVSRTSLGAGCSFCCDQRQLMAAKDVVQVHAGSPVRKRERDGLSAGSAHDGEAADELIYHVLSENATTE